MTRHRTRYPDIHAAAGRPLTLPRDLKNFAANDDEREAERPLQRRVSPRGLTPELTRGRRPSR